MRIDHIRLRNFKGLEQLEQRLHPRFTLIVGDNGTGKTSILDALSVAMGSYLLGIRVPQAASRHIHRDEVRETVRFYGSGPDGQEQYPVEIEARGVVWHHRAKQRVSLRWRRDLTSATSTTTRRMAEGIRNVAQEACQSIQAGQDLDLPLLSYYGAGRLWDRPKSKRGTRAPKPSRFNAYRLSHDPRVSSAELIAWVRDQHIAGFEDGRELPTYKAWKKAVSNCFEAPVDAQFSGKRNRFEIRFQGHGGDGETAVSFDNLSHGQKTIVSMVGDLAYKAMILNPHLGKQALTKTSGIVLIDEIDLHLHPKWQRQIVPALLKTFPKLQFVATTHSPFIIQSLKDGAIVNLDTKEFDTEAYNASIEDIAETIQQVEMPHRSHRHQQLMKASGEYYRLLESAKGEKDKKALAAKRKELDRIMLEFADNPAAAATLKFDRLASRIDG